ncbi:hypothetical protein ASG37_11245 [Sphingomonas sp. Leaf407]|uniref:M16 family metallopeptidase n=1 Tax=unclassified Sphingomonas TaxID=196159 RepID=UPI0006F83F2A|nr:MULTISPECIES: insulinase family protein [unclassified Sphingomonas]KQN37600.1 hypothetical protein ASE97_08535 [Sphingomonas sp. Leaf42]KQT27967.1 hypothetical protein ASG37_11245 [Sphingomonas sp. Leaf407]
MRNWLSMALGVLPLVACCVTADAAPRARQPSARATVPPGGWGMPVTGRLRNGVRFAILPRRGGEPGVGILMRNEGGFIAERRPGERGLAHLIEHVVFHSPTRGSPDDRDHFIRIGLQHTFPAPEVATTSWRESNYFLSTKTRSPADLEATVALLREAASDLTFRADAVDGERASVIAEMADKRQGNAIYADYIAAVAPGSPNDLLEAQNSDDVPTASVATIRELYHRLYQPQNMMLVIVGDVEPAAIRSLIERHFGHWAQTAPPSRPARYPQFRPERIGPVSVATRADGRRAALLAVVMPTPAPPASRDQQRRAQLMDLLLTRAVGDRLAALEPGNPPGKRGVFIENGEQGHRQIMVWDYFAEGQWQAAAQALRRTTCALATTGFTPGEWDAARRNLLADLAQRATDMPKATNVVIAKDLSHALADDRALIPPDELLHHARTLLPRIDVAAGNDWWRAQWRSGTAHLRVEAPELASVADPVALVGQAAPPC